MENLLITFLFFSIWGEWEIDNNQFTAMKLIEGNSCMNEEHRTTKVYHLINLYLF